MKKIDPSLLLILGAPCCMLGAGLLMEFSWKFAVGYALFYIGKTLLIHWAK